MSIPSSLTNYIPPSIVSNQVKYISEGVITQTTVQSAVQQAYTLNKNDITALASNVYTKEEVDTKLQPKANNSYVNSVYLQIMSQVTPKANTSYVDSEISALETQIATLSAGGSAPTSYYAKLAIFTTASDDETTCTLRRSSTASQWVDTGSTASAYYTLNNKVCSMLISVNLDSWSHWNIPTGDILFSYDTPTLFPAPKDTFTPDNIINAVGWVEGNLSTLSGGARDHNLQVKFIKQITAGQIGGFKVLLNGIGMYTATQINASGRINFNVYVTYLIA